MLAVSDAIVPAHEFGPLQLTESGPVDGPWIIEPQVESPWQLIVQLVAWPQSTVLQSPALVHSTLHGRPGGHV